MNLFWAAENMESKKKTEIWAFNILAEAKMRTLILMAKKVHPDWTIKEIKDHLERLLAYCIEKRFHEGTGE